MLPSGDHGSSAGLKYSRSATVAEILRCSKAHIQKLLAGKSKGAAPLPFIPLGRRSLIRGESPVQVDGASFRHSCALWNAPGTFAGLSMVARYGTMPPYLQRWPAASAVCSDA